MKKPEIIEQTTAVIVYIANKLTIECEIGLSGSQDYDIDERAWEFLPSGKNHHADMIKEIGFERKIIEEDLLKIFS